MTTADLIRFFENSYYSTKTAQADLRDYINSKIKTRTFSELRAMSDAEFSEDATIDLADNAVEVGISKAKRKFTEGQIENWRDVLRDNKTISLVAEKALAEREALKEAGTDISAEDIRATGLRGIRKLANELDLSYEDTEEILINRGFKIHSNKTFSR